MLLTLVVGCRGSDTGGGKDPEDKAVADGNDQARLLLDSEGVLAEGGNWVVALNWRALKHSDYIQADLVFATKDRLRPISIRDLKIDPQMPTMGHGTVTEDQTYHQSPDAPWLWRVDGIFLVMAGPWIIHVDAVVDDVKDSALVPVQVPEE